MMDILTWDYVKSLIENNDNNNVLLGNGFSRSYKSEEFNQKTLINEMQSLHGKNITDIEKCIEETTKLLKESEDTVPISIVAKWIKENLQKEFVKKLFEKMPSSIRDKENYDEATLKPYNTFLSLFKNYFTLNYDPIFYWMMLHFQGNNDKNLEKYINIENELLKTSEDDKKYNKIQQKYEDENDNYRKISFDKFINKEEYKMSITYKDSCLYNKTLKDADNDNLYTTNLTKKIYSCIVEQKDSDKNCKEEFVSLDKFKDGFIEACKKENEERKENILVQSFDGFYPESNILTWNKDNAQNVFYLHGAFHILEKDGKTIKIKREVNKPTNKMLDNIIKEWEHGFDSLTVLEGTGKEKIEKIKKYEYLDFCLEQFKSIKGNLITHGVSFADSDNHIIEAINNNNNLENIYIGCYDVPSDEILNKFTCKNKIKLFSTKDMFKI